MGCNVPVIKFEVCTLGIVIVSILLIIGLGALQNVTHTNFKIASLIPKDSKLLSQVAARRSLRSVSESRHQGGVDKPTTTTTTNQSYVNSTKSHEAEAGPITYVKDSRNLHKMTIQPRPLKSNSTNSTITSTKNIPIKSLEMTLQPQPLKLNRTRGATENNQVKRNTVQDNRKGMKETENKKDNTNINIVSYHAHHKPPSHNLIETIRKQVTPHNDLKPELFSTESTAASKSYNEHVGTGNNAVSYYSDKYFTSKLRKSISAI